MVSRWIPFFGIFAAYAASVQAEPAKTDLHGIALGMTVEEAKHAATLPCGQPPFSSELSCHDTADGSDYTASFSAGDPSVALMVAHSFCTHEPPTMVLQQALRDLGASRDGVANDPKGFHVDLDPKTEAILNADDGTCPEGRGKHYMLSLRSNALITTESNKALERARKALR